MRVQIMKMYIRECSVLLKELIQMNLNNLFNQWSKIFIYLNYLSYLEKNFIIIKNNYFLCSLKNWIVGCSVFIVLLINKLNDLLLFYYNHLVGVKL
jgi:hypothetical protein